MQAEIVTIGTELLLGEIVDTNSAWIARQLTTIGLDLHYTTTVGDNLERITYILRQALERADVVITTGGLGPTVDDMTREAVAAATERELVFSEELWEEISRFFARRRFRMTENNRRQAFLPEGALVIHNPVGTAPSFAVEYKGHVIISLPGVPHEMRYLMEHEVLPYLRKRFGLEGIIKSRTLHTCGIGESTIDSKIGDLMHLANPTVGTRAHPGQTDICITAKAGSLEEAEALIAPVEEELRRRLGDRIFGADEESLADVVCRALVAKGVHLAVLETSTQGELAKRLHAASQGVGGFLGGTIAPSAFTLERCFGVSSEVIAKAGFPSQELADCAARAVRQAYGAELGLAIIGPADLGVPNAPPAYFSLATENQVLQGQPFTGRTGPVAQGWLLHLALDLVRRYLLGLPI
ncbi:MAG: CinA family nicotinamide mononucleotide deamidase-related protein [Anaerolineae bacterium]|nr:CinA family nicotinamide mononucleotide deamidase-related protein [Anaerolineae bacterium]